MAQTKRVLITGGHMTPALAVIDELKTRGDFDFYWVGHKFNQSGDREPSAEYKTITGMGIPFFDLPAGKLNRNLGFNSITNLLKIPLGFLVALSIHLRVRPHLVGSFGGYLALPVVFWGRLLRAKVFTHEQTAVTGLANRIISYFAHKIFISWPSSAKYYNPNRTILTGNPIRSDIFEIKSDIIKFGNDLPIIYVTGGNQGSHKVNLAVFNALPTLLKDVNIIHQTGSSSATGDAEKAMEIKDKLSEELATRYLPQPYFFTDNIGEVFAEADLVVCRSGANTTYELLALGKPAIMIPIPWVSHNEQFLNAEIAADTGLAAILEEAELSSKTLIALIRESLKLLNENTAFNSNPLTVAQDQAKELIVQDAAKNIVDQVQDLLK